MSRAPDIQLFACPACAKLYKRRVDVWVDLQAPRPPSSPSVHVPRICVCGRVFLLSESTVIANLPGDGGRGRGRDTLSEFGMDRMDIPAFLRKRDDLEDTPGAAVPGRNRRWWPSGLLGALWNTLKPKPRQAKASSKKDPVQSVLWQMEAIALPEKIAPTQ